MNDKDRIDRINRSRGDRAMKKNWIESQLKRRQRIFGVETVNTAREEQQAVYTATVDSAIEATRMAKAAGLTGRQVWDCVKIALMKTFGVPESVAAFIIRDAWEQAAIGDTYLAQERLLTLQQFERLRRDCESSFFCGSE